ncbi:metallophosphoesterase [Georgenia sp. Z1344]|uniref:metallophosphoesterase n=1 Tax=Georgenia sp. Z1344 TaxID=3416706 RepID=UPI003CF3562B
MHARARRTAAVAATALLTTMLAGAVVPPAMSEPAPDTPPTPEAEPATEGDAAPEEDAVPDGSRWTLATLPDTQFYSRYGASQFEPRYGTNPYQAQAEWLAEVHDELNIPFVTHLGDLVDRAGVEAEWEIADAAHQVLEDAGLPYSVLPGNHDLLNSSANDTELADDEPFLRWFSPERSAAQSPDSGRDPSGFSEYHVFEAEGQEYLVLALAWRTSDETLAWADQVMADHPTLPTILTSHEILGVDSDGVTAVTGGNGERLWEGLIRDNDQIFLTLSGHNHGSAHRVVQNDAGNDVIQILQDWQMAYEGGNGYLGLLEFNLENDSIDVLAPSPWVVGKDAADLTVHDRPLLDAPNEEFSVDIDFDERFAGFNAEWEPGDGQETSLRERARALILDGFEGVPAVDRAEPGSTEDYVRVDGTLAHWRPNLVDAAIGDVLPEGTELPDVVLEEQAMARGPVDTSPTAQEEDVRLCEAHAFSSSDAGICFDNSSNADNRFSYFTTEHGVPVTNATFENGYTIEAFVNIAEDWTAEDNAWTRALARSGNRSRIPGMAQIWDYTHSPASIGFSNLREFQWSVVPGDPTTGDRSAWSGEITSDDWYHLAMVNDPADGSVTMYVDGMPILRNISDGNGMSFEEGYPWMIGAAMTDDAIGSGWHGGVGEVRVIDRATEPGEWLIDRPDVEAFEIENGELEVGPDGSVPALTGTGASGATVVLDGALTGEAVVAEDGTWSVEPTLVDEAAGTREFAVSHGFGERRSGDQLGQITVPDDEEPPVDPGEPVPPTPGRGFYLNDGWDAWADHEFSFGRPGDEVLVGDWDGDGSDTLAVRRGNAYFLSNSLYGGDADVELTFGRSGDTVLVGDWDGDGVDSFAVRRGNSYFLTNELVGGDAETELDYGRANDQVLVGDYDGNGTDTFAVRRGARYFVSNSLSSGWADEEFTYGRSADQVLVGDWDGDGSDTFASRRGNLYLMSNTLTGGWADREVRYGRSGDEVFVGDWNADGSDTLGIRR